MSAAFPNMFLEGFQPPASLLKNSVIARVNRKPCKKRIVILGGGFGGVYAAMHLEKSLGRESAMEICLRFQASTQGAALLKFAADTAASTVLML